MIWFSDSAKTFIFLIQAKYMYRIATSGFEEMYDQSTRELEMVKRLSPDSPIVNICSHMLKNVRTFLYKKMSLLQK